MIFQDNGDREADHMTFQRPVQFSAAFGVRNLGLTCVTMAKALRVSPSAVSKSIACGRSMLQTEDIEDKLMKNQ